MISSLSILNVADNSGPTKVQCIKVLNGAKHAHINQYLIVSFQSGERFKKGNLFKALIVRTKKGLVRPNGIRLLFPDNAVILLNTQNQLIASRIIGPIPRELRQQHQLKVLSLATYIY